MSISYKNYDGKTSRVLNAPYGGVVINRLCSRLDRRLYQVASMIGASGHDLTRSLYGRGHLEHRQLEKLISLVRINLGYESVDHFVNDFAKGQACLYSRVLLKDNPTVVSKAIVEQMLKNLL